MNVENKTAQNVHEYIVNGDFQQAVTTAKEVLDTNPDDVFCLSVVAQSEFNQGKLENAVTTLNKALKIQPKELMLNRNLGMIYNRLGQFKKSTKAFARAIEHNADHPEIQLDVLLAGISMNKLDEKLSARVIEFAFANAGSLRTAYQNREELPMIVEASHIGNDLIRNARYKEQKKAIDEISLGFEASDTKRLYDFLDAFHGKQAPKYAHDLQRPSYHVFPDLEPITFYNNEQFSWVQHLQDNYKEIKQELNALYEDSQNIKPYIESGSSTGNDGLDVLVDSLDWSSIHLIKAGGYNQKLLDKCPVTDEVLKKLPMPVLAGNGPEVFMSILKPGAEIKPHFGLSNVKLTVHLGLEIPENCAIQVGEDIQSWSDGKVTVFDDSFQHSAWNRSDKERKVLIIEVWNPDLSQLEIQGIQKVMELQNKVTQTALHESLEKIVADIKSVA